MKQRKDADGNVQSLQEEAVQEEKKAVQAEKKAVSRAKKRNKLARGGKVGRPRKLSPAELRRGVEAYFASISYLEPVMREEYIILSVDPKTGAVEFQLDKMGHRAVRQVPVLGADGKPLSRLVYTQAPGDFGLCDYLKISRDTWERYGRAVELLEERRQEQASGDGEDGGRPMTAPTGNGGTGNPASVSRGGLTEDPEMLEAREYAEIYALARGRVCAYLESAAETKGGKGAVFKLERIYGLKEQKELTVSAGDTVEAYIRSLGGEAEY